MVQRYLNVPAVRMRTLKKVDQFVPCMMYIDVVEKNGAQKLKITHVDLPEQKSGGVK